MRTQALWKVETHMALARGPTSCSTRSFISPAALFVNVIARIWPGWTWRSASNQAMRWVSTRVLPEPAPATISSGDPSWTTASRWRGLRPSSNAAPRAVRGWTVRAGSSNSALIVFEEYRRLLTGPAVAHSERATEQAIFLRVPDTGARGLLTSPHDAPESSGPGAFSRHGPGLPTWRRS